MNDLFNSQIAIAPKGVITESNGNCANSTGERLFGYKIYGNSTQDGTPTPSAPIPIVSLGESGSITVKCIGKNLFDKNYWQSLSDSQINAMLIKIYDTDSTINYKRFVPLGIGAGTYTFKVNGTTEVASGYYEDLADIKDGVVVSKQIIYDAGYFVTVTITVTGELCIGQRFSYTSDSNQPLWIIRQLQKDEALTQIESGSVATVYEEYKSTKRAIVLSAPLRGIGTAQDELDFREQMRINRVGIIIFDGTENWTATRIGTAQERYFCPIDNLFYDSYTNSILTNISATTYSESNIAWDGTDMVCVTNADGKIRWYRISVTLPQITSVALWKNYLSTQYANGTPVYIIYELENKTTELLNLPDIETVDGTCNITVSDGTTDGTLSVKYYAEK